jgi:hypothetical protein
MKFFKTANNDYNNEISYLISQYSKLQTENMELQIAEKQLKNKIIAQERYISETVYFCNKIITDLPKYDINK